MSPSNSLCFSAPFAVPTTRLSRAIRCTPSAPAPAAPLRPRLRRADLLRPVAVASPSVDDQHSPADDPIPADQKSNAEVPASPGDVSAQKNSIVANEDEPLDEVAMRAAEIHEVLSGLKDFKSRIIDDATALAKKVRAPKKQLDAALKKHPDIVRIDGHIAELEDELRTIGDR